MRSGKLIVNVGVACLELGKLGDRLSESVYFLEGWPEGEIDNKLTRASKKHYTRHAVPSDRRAKRNVRLMR